MTNAVKHPAPPAGASPVPDPETKETWTDEDEALYLAANGYGSLRPWTEPAETAGQEIDAARADGEEVTEQATSPSGLEFSPASRGCRATLTLPDGRVLNGWFLDKADAAAWARRCGKMAPTRRQAPPVRHLLARLVPRLSSRARRTSRRRAAARTASAADSSGSDPEPPPPPRRFGATLSPNLRLAVAALSLFAVAEFCAFLASGILAALVAP